MSRNRLRLGSLVGLMVAVATAVGQDAPEATTAAGNETETTTTRPPLTGNPQIDYKYDPNLPHELLGYDLSEYPFYARLPQDLLDPKFNFTCDGRHDGFYASVPHKCQVYHNCLFGQRYDFLCANYTVFDQKNFICHYVSEVDCVNSADHYDRNDELYETTTTTTAAPPPPQIIYVERPPPLLNRPRPGGNRPRPLGGFRGKRPGPRRPTTTTPPPSYYDYDYDYYYDQYYDEYYNDYANERTTTTTTTTTQRPRRPLRPQRTRVGNRNNVEERSRPSGRFGGVFNVRDRKQPRINPPVPKDAEDDFRPRASRLQQDGPLRRQNLNEPSGEEPTQGPRREQGSGSRRRRPRPFKKSTTTTTTTTTEAAPDYYYDDYYEYYDQETSSTTTTTTEAPSRPTLSRGGSRNRPRRPEPSPSIAEEPEKEQPSGARPGRVNVRKSPVVNRRVVPTSVEEVPQEITSEPKRNRPSFPRRQNEPEVVVEDAPLAPGIDLAPEEEATGPSATADRPAEARRRPGRRRPLRRGSGTRREEAPRSSGPDDYDY